MKIYKLIADARVKFQNSSIKKSGLNKFAGYSYYELSDILPVINKIGQELGFTCLVSFTSERAELKIIAHEDGSDAVFTSPMATANLKGCHDVQNLGAVETYIKRYLYQNAFEIVENDALDGTMNPSEKPLPTTKHKGEEIPVVDNLAQTGQAMLQTDCARLSKELGLTEAQKAQMWKDSGQSFMNLKIMLDEKINKEIEKESIF